MIRTTTQFEVLSDEPPAQVTSEIVWRLAVRLFRDHGPAGPDDDPRRCARCDQPWPCSGRRLAELGLNAAVV